MAASGPARGFATKTRCNNADMGLNLLVEPSASGSEMHVMDFDGCGCVLALQNSDGLDERFLEVAKGLRKTRAARPKTRVVVAANHVSPCRIQNATVILFVHHGTRAMQHDFTIYILYFSSRH